jgi:hypothetical protein
LTASPQATPGSPRKGVDIHVGAMGSPPWWIYHDLVGAKAMSDYAYRCIDPAKRMKCDHRHQGRYGGRVLSTHQMVNPALQNSGARTNRDWVGVAGMFEPTALKIL